MSEVSSEVRQKESNTDRLCINLRFSLSISFFRYVLKALSLSSNVAGSTQSCVFSHREKPLNFDTTEVFQYRISDEIACIFGLDNSKHSISSCVCFFSGEVLSYIEHQFPDSWHKYSTADIVKLCVLSGKGFSYSRIFYFETLFVAFRSESRCVFSRHSTISGCVIWWSYRSVRGFLSCSKQHTSVKFGIRNLTRI